MRLWQTIGMIRFLNFIVGAVFVGGILAGVTYTPSRLDAATASVTYTFSAGQRIVADQLNQNNTDIINAINGNLNSVNILDGGIATADLATHAVSKIKLAQQNIATSSITSGFSLGASGSVVGVATLSLVTVGRPTIFEMVADGTGNNQSYVGMPSGGQVQFILEVDDSTKSIVVVNSGAALNMPCSNAFRYVDQTSTSGTHTYALKVQSTNAMTLTRCRLVVQEM